MKLLGACSFWPYILELCCGKLVNSSLSFLRGPCDRVLACSLLGCVSSPMSTLLNQGVLRIARGQPCSRLMWHHLSSPAWCWVGGIQCQRHGKQHDLLVSYSIILLRAVQWFHKECFYTYAVLSHLQGCRISLRTRRSALMWSKCLKQNAASKHDASRSDFKRRAFFRRVSLMTGTWHSWLYWREGGRATGAPSNRTLTLPKSIAQEPHTGKVKKWGIKEDKGEKSSSFRPQLFHAFQASWRLRAGH